MSSSVTSSGKATRLITGVPRSGTTLCCHILNQQQNMVALHEPIRPDQFKVSEASITEFVASRCEYLKSAIFNGDAFEHGHKGGLLIDNPVGLEQKQGKRQVVAQRGMVTLSQFANTPISLIVKQNAFFTAYLSQLSSSFDILCVVRNPVDVLLSWWTVDLPVSRGVLPAGTNNSVQLRERLSVEHSVIGKQLAIYQWFIDQFIASGSKILKYEDIIASDGMLLTDYFDIASPTLKPLEQPVRDYHADILRKLELAAESIMALNCGELYSRSYIESRIESLL